MTTTGGTEKLCPTCGAKYTSEQVFCANDGDVLVAPSRTERLIGKVIADRYRIIESIGEGGMGQVFLAEHVHMKRKCAVKLLQPDLAGDPDAIRRFIREAANASRVSHPNVVTIYDFGDASDGMVYLAMEFIEGESLKSVLKREGPLPLARAAQIIKQVCDALAAAHEMDIVHRDLKPDNIMIVRGRDGIDRVKVVDFGIAKTRAEEQKVTVSGAVVGTPDYMSPEQVGGGNMDGRSDQYAAALVAMKMLTGELPFSGATSYETLTSRLSQPPRKLSELRSDIQWPAGLEDVLLKALSPKAEDRYEDMATFGREFARAAHIARVSRASDRTEIMSTSGATELINVPPTKIAPPKDKSRKSPALLYGGGGVALLAAGLAFFFVTKGGSPTPAADSTAAAQTQASAPDSQGQRLGLSSTPAPLAEFKREVAGPRPQGAAGSTGTPATAGNPAGANGSPAAPASSSGTTVASATAPAGGVPPGGGANVVAAANPSSTPPAAIQAAAPVANPVTADDLASLRKLVTPDAENDQLAQAVIMANRLLPRAAQRSDSIRILFTKAQALVFADRQDEGCKVLGNAQSLAAGSSLEAAITRTFSQVGCR